MESKLIIFLAFASLAQGSLNPTWGAPFKLTRNQLDVLDKILAKYDATSSEQSKGWNSYFSLFVEQADFPADGPSSLNQILSRLSQRSTGIWEAAALATKGSTCSPALKSAKNQSATYSSDVVAKISSGTKLAKFGSHSKNKNTIESYHDTVKNDFAQGLQLFYDALAASFGDDDKHVKAVIKEALQASIRGLNQLTDAVFDVIELRSKASASTVKTLKYAIKVKQLEARASQGAKIERDNKYSVLNALYIANELGETELLKPLYAYQYALVSSRGGYFFN